MGQHALYGQVPLADVIGLSDTLAGLQPLAGKNQANGYAGLDSGGLVLYARLPVGTGANTIAAGNDARFTDSRAPSGAAGGSLTGTYPNPTLAAGSVIGTSVASALKDPAVTTAGMRTLGTGALQAAAGNDSRITGAIQSTQRGVANGVAELDSSGLLPRSRTYGATATLDGTIRLAGDLGGTYTAPTVPGLAGKVDTTRQVLAGTGATGGGPLSADVTIGVAYGTTAGTAAAGNDARLSDQRAPLASLANVANGWAKLDGAALLPTSLLPALAISEVFSPASQAEMLALTAQRGDVAIRNDGAAVGGYILATDDPSTLANWKRLPTPADAVLSVNGQIGVVNLGYADVGAAAAAHGHAASAITSGVLDIARLPVGTGASTVAAGDDARFTSAVAYSRLPVGTTASTVAAGDDARFTAAIAYSRLPVGTAASTVAAGNDSRIVGAVQTGRQIISGTGLTGGGDLSADRTLAVSYGSAAGTAVQGNDARVTADQAAGTASIRTLGTGALQAAAGNDSRLSDARTPVAHSAALITSGTVDIARLPTGTTGTTVALGNDSRFTDARAPLAHDASLVTTGTLGYGRLPVGTAASTVAAGDDARFTSAVSYSRLPVGTAASTVAAGDDARFTGAVAFSRLPVGTTASTVAVGNDSRLSDARPWTLYSPGGGPSNGQMLAWNGTAYVPTSPPSAVSGGFAAGLVPAGSITPTITHGLGTTDVVITVREVSTGRRIWVSDDVTTTQATLTFTTAPTSGQYRWTALSAAAAPAVVDAGTINTGRLGSARLPLADVPTILNYAATLTLDHTSARAFATTLGGNCAVSMNAAAGGDNQAVTFEAFGGSGGGQVTFPGSGLLSGLTSPFAVPANKVGLFGLRYSARAARWVVTSAGIEQ